MPRNYLSIYADPGVNIKVKNSSGAVLINTSSTGVLDRNEVIYDKITSYTGGVFHLYQLKEYAASTNLAEFFVEVETTSTQPLHYNIWFGCPLFAESRTSMSVPTRTLNKPNTTSAAVSTTTRANAVPANSWIKSMYYTISFQSGAGNLSIMYDSVRVPSDPSRYQMILSGNRYNFALNNTYAYKAQGTYSHRFEYCRWNGSSSAGNSYSNSATCYVEYYYVFGRGDTPIYS